MFVLPFLEQQTKNFSKFSKSQSWRNICEQTNKISNKKRLAKASLRLSKGSRQEKSFSEIFLSCLHMRYFLGWERKGESVRTASSVREDKVVFIIFRSRQTWRHNLRTYIKFCKFSRELFPSQTFARVNENFPLAKDVFRFFSFLSPEKIKYWTFNNGTRLQLIVGDLSMQNPFLCLSMRACKLLEKRCWKL